MLLHSIIWVALSNSPMETAYPICNYCQKSANFICTGCESAHYCGLEHQKLDWHRHKRQCDSVNVNSDSSNKGWRARLPFMSKSLNLIHDLERVTTDNIFYRKVIATTGRMQLVLMHLTTGDFIGDEVHKDTDQFFRVEKGEIKVTLWQVEHKKMLGRKVVHYLKDGFSLIVPAGTGHRVDAMIDTHLYTIYSPPEHKPDTQQLNNPDYPYQSGDRSEITGKNWPTRL